MKRNRIFGIQMGLAMMPFLLAPARAQAPFCEGKTITIVIGTASGGSIVGSMLAYSVPRGERARRALLTAEDEMDLPSRTRVVDERDVESLAF
jgi:hypothetical protein